MKESLIYLVLLVDRKDRYCYEYKYRFYINTNPMDDSLSCLRNKNIENVRTIEEIENDEYTTNDDELFEIRLRDMKGEYSIISKELIDYYDDNLNNNTEFKEFIFPSLLTDLDLEIDLDEYRNIKKRIIRNSKLSDLGI